MIYPTWLTGENLKMNLFYDRIAPFYHFFESFLGWILAGNGVRPDIRTFERNGL